jgi:hypothetical protein
MYLLQDSDTNHETASCRTAGKAYIRPKVIRHFSRPCASGSYVHQATFFLMQTTCYSIISYLRPESYVYFDHLGLQFLGLVHSNHICL